MFPLVRIHGRWCGPNWTDGKAQPANAAGVNFKGKCDDPLDCACRAHDQDCSHPDGCSRKGDAQLILVALKEAANPINRIFKPVYTRKAEAVAAGISAALITRKR